MYFLSSPTRLLRSPKEQPARFPARKLGRVETDFRNLLDRVNQRLYPETIPVLASYWLKTVYWNRYARAEWRELDKLLRTTSLAGTPVAEHWLQVVTDIRNWIRESADLSPKEAQDDWRASPARRSSLGPDVLAAYTIRLLNQWLPLEEARLLVAEREAGIPVLTTGRALERLLLRDRLSIPTLEALLNPDLLSARFVYPADLEILRDVVLFLLGRTCAPAPATLPAILLATTPDARLFEDYSEQVGKAYLVRRAEREELHVPITPDQAIHVLAEAPARIGSVVVSADGRCWEPVYLQRGDQNVIIYRSRARLRLDYTADHVRLRIPWPDARRTWSGALGFPQPLELFGRQWNIAMWERDAADTWLSLVFARAIPATALARPPAASSLRRSGLVSADLAWAELEIALASAVAHNQWSPLDQLQREELIPLGRAVFGLAQSVMRRRDRTPESIESHLKRIRFLQSGVKVSYGLIPWRILPKDVRRTLLASHVYATVLELLREVFAGVPEPRAASFSLLGATWFRAHTRRPQAPESQPPRQNLPV